MPTSPSPNETELTLFSEDEPDTESSAPSAEEEDREPITLGESLTVYDTILRSDGDRRQAQRLFWQHVRHVGHVPPCPGYGATRGKCQNDCDQMTEDGLVGAVYFTWACAYCRELARVARLRAELHHAAQQQQEQQPARRRGSR